MGRSSRTIQGSASTMSALHKYCACDIFSTCSSPVGDFTRSHTQTERFTSSIRGLRPAAIDASIHFCTNVLAAAVGPSTLKLAFIVDRTHLQSRSSALNAELSATKAIAICLYASQSSACRMSPALPSPLSSGWSSTRNSNLVTMRSRMRPPPMMTMRLGPFLFAVMSLGLHVERSRSQGIRRYPVRNQSSGASKVIEKIARARSRGTSARSVSQRGSLAYRRLTRRSAEKCRSRFSGRFRSQATKRMGLIRKSGRSSMQLVDELKLEVERPNGAPGRDPDAGDARPDGVRRGPGRCACWSSM
jgi:hypothetical protein